MENIYHYSKFNVISVGDKLEFKSLRCFRFSFSTPIREKLLSGVFSLEVYNLFRLFPISILASFNLYFK